MAVYVIAEGSRSGYFSVNGIDYKKNHYCFIQDTLQGLESEYNFSIKSIYTEEYLIRSRGYAEVSGVSSWGELLTLLEKLGIFASNDVSIQDQSTPPFDLFFSMALGAPTTLTQEAAIDTRVLNVASVANITQGVYLGIFSGSGRYYWGTVLSVVGLVVTLDTPLDFTFPIGSNVLPTTRNLAVNGSVTPQIFSIQAGSSGLSIDITRVLFSMITQDPIQLNLFGDGAALVNGIVLRKVDGVYRNYFNIKTNYEFGLHAFDIGVYAQNLPNDLNAFICRNSYAGQDKRGVVIRLAKGEELQMIIQDDLTTRCDIFNVIAEGHEVLD